MPMTSGVLGLLLANTLIFLIQQMGFNAELVRWFALWPLGSPGSVMTSYGMVTIPQFEPWQLASYGFLHGSVMHLFFNMFGLWMFGVGVEALWGTKRFLQYYAVCVLGAGVVQLAVASIAAQSGGFYPTIGASGGVLGVLLAYAMMYPDRIILLLIPPIPMKAKWFVLIYGAFELWAGVTGTQAGVAHFAHIGGMLFGFLMIQYWRRGWPFARGRS